MPTLQSARIQTRFEADYRDSTTGARQAIAPAPVVSFTDGATSGLANRAYKASYTITTGSPTQDIDLTALTDALGNSLSTVTKLKALLVEHLPASAASGITVGAGTNPVFGTKIVALDLGAGDHLCVTRKAGWTITNASADVLRIVNTDGSNSASVRVTALMSA